MKHKFLLIYISSYKYGYGHQSRCFLISNFLKKKNINHKKINLINSSISEIEGLIIKSNKIILDITNKTFLINNKKLFSSLINFLSDKKVYVFDSFDNYSINSINKKENFYYIIPYLYKFFNKKNMYEGTNYFPIKSNNFYKKKYINKRIKNILISFGGSDIKNYSSKLLKNFNKKKYEDLNIVVIIGKYQKKINLNNFCFKIKFVQTNNLLPYFKWSDLSFISSGLTKYESIYSRSPSVILEDKNDDKFLNTFLKKNFLGFYINQKIFFKNFEYYFNSFCNFKKRSTIFKNTNNIIPNNSLSNIYKIFKL